MFTSVEYDRLFLKRVQPLCFILALTAVCSISQATAQTSPVRHQFWFNPGAGLVIADNFAAFGKSISVYYKTNSFVLSARFLNADRIQGVTSLHPPFPDLDFVREYAVSAGYAKGEQDGTYGICAGVGYTQGKYNQRRDYTTFSVPTLVLETWGFLNLSRSVGVGISLLGNLNSKRSYGGVFLSVQIGTLG